MIVGGDGARASQAVRMGRGALLRNALLGSTALIGVAVGTPAMAQTAVVSSGGTVSGTGSYIDGTSAGGGVTYTSTAYNGTVTFNGVSVNDTTGAGSTDALRINALYGSLVMRNAGSNTLATTRNGGSALRLSSSESNVSWGVSQIDTTSVLTLAGSYGIYADAAGFIDLIDLGAGNSIGNVTANGTALVGINLLANTGANATLKTPTISGFQTGIRALTNSGVTNVVTTGGAINASSIGIDADATNGNITIDEASQIVAPTGIDANASGNVTITTRGNVDSTALNTGTGINATGGGTVAVTVASGYVGLGTHFGTGINAVGGVGLANTIKIDAHVRGATGVIAGAGAFTTTVNNEINGMSAAGYGIQDNGGGAIINNGNIYSNGTAVALTAGGSLINRSSITGAGGTAVSVSGTAATTLILATGSSTTGNIAVSSSGATSATIAGTLTGNYAAATSGAAQTVTLATTGNITGAVALGTAGGTFSSYGVTSGGLTSGATGATINLYAGSATDSLNLGAGNDTVAIWNGQINASAVTQNYTDPASGATGSVTLQAAGTLAQAQVAGGLNLGGGYDTLELRGTGTGAQAGGLSLTGLTGVELLSKIGTGTWTIGNTASTPGVTINAGNGTPSGTLIFSGSTGLTGTILVNGALIRAASAGAFGTATINMIDPTVQYGATGTYSNPIVLMSVDPAGDPARLQADAGVTATLTGAITQGGGAAQPLVFDGLGTIVLTNAANDYAGLTSINAGTVVERNTASALGSGGVAVASGATLQFDNQTGGGLSIEAGSYTGGGTIRFTGNAGAVTILGNAGNVTFSLGSGGLVDVQSGIVAGSASGQGFWTGNLADLNVAAGATFDGVEGNIRVDALTGAGTVRNGYFGQGSLTLGVDNGSGTFSGAIANSTNPSSPLILIKTGTGTQTLTGNNTYTGSTTISGGTLALAGTSTLNATPIINNAAFDISGHTGNLSILTMTGSGTTNLGANTLVVTNGSGTYNGTISGTGGLNLTGGGWTLGGSSNYSGGTTISSGTLIATSTLALGSGAIVNNGTLTFSLAFGGARGGSISGSGIVSVGGTGRLLLNGTVSNTGGLLVNTADSKLTISGTRTAASGIGASVTGDRANLAVAASGSIQTTAATAVSLTGMNATLDNLGSISAGAGFDAVTAGSSTGALTITNGSASNSSASILGGNNGIYRPTGASGLLTLNNYGSITGDLRDGIENLAGAGPLVINNYGTGVIDGQGNVTPGTGSGIANVNSTLTVSNASVIMGLDQGIYTGGAFTLSSNSGIIAGQANGIVAAAGALITNSGTIGTGTVLGGVFTATNSGGDAISLTNGSITNDAGGLIVGQNGAAVRFTGAGTASLTNAAGATIRGRGGVLASSATSATVTNSGIIETTANGNGNAVSITTGTITNNLGGIIRQQSTASVSTVYATGAATVVNDGTISNVSNSGYGVRINGTGAVINSGGITAVNAAVVLLGTGSNTVNNSGTIFGSYGVGASNGPVTLTNTGSIEGSIAAIDLGLGAFDDTLNLDGGTVTGAVNVYDGDDTINLRGGTVSGAFDLGDGNDVFNWTGGSFSSTVNAGTGTDTLNVNLAAPATLDLGALSGFEAHNLDGGALTLGGALASGDGGWQVNGGSLNLVSGAQLWATGHGVQLNASGTSVTIADGASVVGYTGFGVTANTGASISNDGLVRSTGTGLAGALLNGGTLTNQAAGLIVAEEDGVRLTAASNVTNAGIIVGYVNGVNGGGGAQTLVNSGVIVTGQAVDATTQLSQIQRDGSGSGVTFSAGGSVTNSNTGFIGGNHSGVVVTGGAGTVSNTGMIEGSTGQGVYLGAGGSVTNNAGGSVSGGVNGVSIAGGAATLSNAGTIAGGSGYAISVNATAASTIDNLAGGTITGGSLGAIELAGSGDFTLNLRAGSTTNGNILATGSGLRTAEIWGTLNGDYDATLSGGSDTVILHDTGSVANVDLGAGNDYFAYLGGTITGIVDGGAGNDALFADFGVGNSYNVSLANFVNFEAFGLLSGDMTLTDASANPGAAIYAGAGGVPAGTITFTNTSNITGDIYVNGGTIRATTAGAFGSGTIHMIDPTAIFAADGTYANNIDLQAVDTLNDPAKLRSETGGLVTLTGAITESLAAQNLVFEGTGGAGFVLTNTGNRWTGATVIATGGALTGNSATISGAAITNNGTLTYNQAANGTVWQDITGTGNFVKAGTGDLTLAGTNSWAGTTQIASGGLIGTTDSISGSSVAMSGGLLYFEQANSGTFAANISGSDGGVFVKGLAAGNTLTFSGTSTYTGSITVTDGSAIAFTGSVNSGTGVSVALAGAGGSVTNSGTITGVRAIDAMAADTSVTNLAGGTINGTTDSAVVFWMGGTLNNAGTLTASGTPATVYMTGATGSVTNAAGGIIGSTASAGVNVDAASFTVDNAGQINGVTGVYIGTGAGTGGTVTNQVGGTITGTSYGIQATRAGLTVDNYGSISGGTIANTSAVYLSGANVTVINEAGATISGWRGIVTAGANAIVTNYGTVTGTVDNALSLDGGGTGTNALGGILNATAPGGWGIFVNNTGTAINNGTINADIGIAFAAGGTHIANNSGTINGNTAGVATWNGASAASLVNSGTIAATTGAGVNYVSGGSVTNSGTITGGTAGYGIATTGATTITNQSGGKIEGGLGALYLDGAAAITVNLNAGSTTIGTIGSIGTGDRIVNISGTLTGNYVGGAGVDALTIDTGATVTGTLSGGAGNDTLALVGTGSATLGAVTGFESATKSGTGTWTLGTANDVASWTVTGGTLATGGAIDNAALVNLATGGTLQLTADEGIGTLSGTGTVSLGNHTLGLLAGTSSFDGSLTGTGNLLIDGANLTFGGTAGYTGVTQIGSGSLTLAAGASFDPASTLLVSAAGTLDLSTIGMTVSQATLYGTLNGASTLTATTIALNGATVNGNLSGAVGNTGGVSLLNGTISGGNVSVTAGTLRLGAANRIADTAELGVAQGATFDLQGYDETVALAGISGTLAGTGTLTASQYQLTGATVNANLGTGTLVNLGGSSVLNGTAAGDVSVQAGTLVLGAANRLADTAIVSVASLATLNIGAFNDTVAALALNGTLDGTGTLTAGQYQLTGATVNANLSAGTLFNLGGSSVLNGTAAGNVSVQAGTLTLGAANRLADTATVVVSTGATLNIGAFNDTVAALALNGTLAGTGTLTAAEYQLSTATVNANVGAGTVYNLAGISTLNGTVGANTVTVQGGTLRLGAGERLANTATLGIASGGTFDLAGYTETVGGLAGSGTLALGAGKLVLSNTSEQSFGGAITGTGSIDKQGLGRLNLAGTFATTGRFDVTAGTLAFSGSTQGSIRVQGGTLIGSGTVAGALTIASGTFSPGGLNGALGTVNPIGSFTVGSLVASGGTLLFDVGGTALNFAADSIKVNGTATLTGGTVAINALSAVANDYRFNQTYVIISAGSISGTFANGATFADVTGNNSLKWRLRYDLVPNSVVLQVQKGVDFAADVGPGDPNSLAVAQALMGGAGSASDSWSNTLNALSALTPAQRIAAYRSFTGEILADVSTATISANNLFTDLLRQRVGDGSDALVGGGFASSSLADVRTTTTAGNSFASALSSATLPGTGAGDDTSRGGIWGQVYGGYQKLLGDGVHAGVENTTAGVAMGVETRLDGFTLGVAGGVAQIDSDVNSRNSTVSGNQYQLGGYASYDAGSLFVAASGSWYSADFDSRRTLSLGGTTSLAIGDISSKGYSFGVTGGFRTELGNGLRLALIGSASKVHDERDGFNERAVGGLGLQVASASRDLFTASGELRLGATVKTGAGVAMPWVSMGVRYNSGDLDTLGAMRFSGAPAGTGAFGVAGTRIAPVLGTLGVGIDARASKNVRLGIALEGAAGENTREGRASVRVKIGF